MSGHWPPPPGPAGPPPPPGQPGWGTLGDQAHQGHQGQPSGWPPAPAPFGGPPPLAPRPGAVPLRPLRLGDLFDGAFRIIRRNAGATVGAAVLVASLAMLLPLVVAAVGTFGGWGLTDAVLEDGVTDDELGSFGAVFGTLFLGTALQGVGLVLVGGMTAQVTAAAVVGRRMTLAQAWAATRGRRWRLLGLTATIGLLVALPVAAYAGPLLGLVLLDVGWLWPLAWGVLGFGALVVALCWLWIRLAYFSMPSLMLEAPRVFGAIGRGRRLTRGAFWRIFGIALLTNLAALVGSQIVSTPISVLAELVPLVTGPDYAMLTLVIGQAAGSIVAAAFATPFLSVVAALQYLDQRIRTEAYDVVLMEQAGLIEP